MSTPRDSQHIPVNFASFVVSLGSSALVHLGEIDDPTAGTRAPNPRLARDTIDLLEVLEVKTKGNLSSEEATLLSTILKELREKVAKAPTS